MALTEIWSKWFSRRAGAERRRTSSGRSRLRHRPAVELLEDRTLPSAAFGLAFGLGSSGEDIGFDVTTDASSNVYVSGRFQGTVDFDPAAAVVNLTSAGSIGDAFVAKYTSAGALVWARSMGGPGVLVTEGRSVTLDSAGNVIVGGGFTTGTVDFDPGAGVFNLTAVGSSDGFILKLDAGGNFVWARLITGSSGDGVGAVTTDTPGNVYVTGGFGDIADLDPGPGTFTVTRSGANPGGGAFVLKLDSAGTFVWGAAADVDGSAGFDIALEASGNVLTTGGFTGTVDFDPGPGVFNLTSTANPAGNNNAYIWKLNNNGNFVWARSFSGVGSGGQGVTVDSAANVYTVGGFLGTVDFDPGAGTFNLSSVGSRDVFVSKLNTDGNFVWARAMGGSGDDFAGQHGLALDSAGNVYVGGRFEGTADFDPGAGVFNLASAGNSDVFVSKLDSSGNLAWAVRMGGSTREEGTPVVVDGSNNVYATGIFNLAGPAGVTADFDPGPGVFNLTSAGNSDVFVSKLVALPPSLSLASSTFFGGAGDQRGTAIAIAGGAIYLSGNVQPESQQPSDTALVVKYGIAPGPSPLWSRNFGFGSNFRGIAATNEGVYAGGWNYSLTSDPVGGKEVKTLVGKFAPDGSSGPGPGGSQWVAGSGGTASLAAFFVYSGVEFWNGLTTAVEGGTTYVYAAGFGQPCSFGGSIVAKYDTLGNRLAAATDSSQGLNFNTCFVPSGGGASASAVTVLNGSVYVAGGANQGGVEGPTIWKHDANLNLIWRQRDASIAAHLLGISSLGGAIYGVGHSFTPGVAGSENYLIQKYDEAGNRLWSTSFGAANTDVLTGVVGIGSRLFAVGYTASQGAGGTDAVVLDINPATGAILSTTLFGGAQDDKANGVATNGTDLYVVGESRSFAQGGNAVGQNDGMLLRYTPVGNGKIAFQRGAHEVAGEIYVMQPDGSGQTNLTNHSAADTQAAWSPDGGKIAFASDRDGNFEIYVMNANGTNATRLTNNIAVDFWPTWSPDGTKIAFQSLRDGNNDIYVINADGSGETRLTFNAAPDVAPDWSPDGSKIAFYSERDGIGHFQIYVMNAADGSGQTNLSNFSGNDFNPAWSPDGTKIALQRDITGNVEIFVMNADGSGQTNVTNHPANDAQPAWSPDGTKMLFRSQRDGFGEAASEIYMMNADGTNQTRLTFNTAFDGEPDWQAVSANQLPTANAGGPYTVAEGGSVVLTGSGSDPDGDSLTYAWDLDNNGTFETSGQNVTFSAAGRDGPSSQTVMLRVSDNKGASAASSGTVTITNVAPTLSNVRLVDPASGLAVSSVNEGSPVRLTGNITDPGTPDTFTLTINWGDGTETVSLPAGTTTFARDHTYADDNPTGTPSDQYTISVMVTDDDGGTAAAQGWTAKVLMPTPRGALDIGIVNGVLYAVGGFDGSPLATLEAYDPASSTWTTKAPMATPRNGVAVGVVNGVLYAVGGFNGSPLASVEAYDSITNTWTPKTPMPTARVHLDVGVVNGILYAVGGASGAGGFSTVVEAYDPATNTWTTKAAMSTGRHFLGVEAVDGILYAVGGETLTAGGFGTVEAYDPVTNTWTSKAPMLTPRGAHAVGVVNNRLYAVGGNSSTATQVTTVESYDPAANIWTAEASMPTGRDLPAAGVVNGILYAVGGRNNSGLFLGTVEAFTPAVRVTVNNVAPTVNTGGNATVNEGSTFSRTGSFTDPGSGPNETWTAQVDYGDGGGSQPLTLNPDKTFNLSHVYADNGSYSVTVQVRDDDMAAGTFTTTSFQVTVNNVAPVANNDAATTNEDTPVLINVLANDTDVPADPLTVTGVSSPTANGGTVTNNGNGTVTYTPALNFFGSDMFTYTISDGDGGTASATVTVTVNSINDAPVNTVPAPQSASPNGSLVFSALNGNALSVADVDAGAAAVQATLSASSGTLTLSGTTGLAFTSGDGTADAGMTFTGTLMAINAALDGLRYDPAAGFSGVASVTITSNDQGNSGAGGALTDTDTVPITVSTAATIDLVLTVSANPDPAAVGSNLTYTLTVTNAGSFMATGVTLFDNLPNSVAFVSATASQGTGCTQSGGIVTCGLGGLMPGASAGVTIVVTPTKQGMIVNRASVAANERDSAVGNNMVVSQTRVNPGVPLRLAPELAPAGPSAAAATNAVLLTPEMVRPLLAEAGARWQATGVAPETLTALDKLEVQVTDLPESYLGMASPTILWLDDDAARQGWFIDPTPAADEEFPATADSPAHGKVDLLTVVTHEVGHLLGFGHDEDDDLMADSLAPGVRYFPRSHVTALAEAALPAEHLGTATVPPPDGLIALLSGGTTAFHTNLTALNAIMAEWASPRDYATAIANLGGTTLGLAAGNTIWLDDNAAGWGWFVDATPWDDSEFTTPGNQGEQHRMDLLTILAHEIGHLLGHDHEDDGVMIDSLATGIRRMPGSTEVNDWSAILDVLVAEPLSKRRW